MAPRFAIVRSSDLARCPGRVLSADHWIDGHHVEECIPAARALVVAVDAALERERVETMEALKVRQAAARRDRLDRIRRDFAEREDA